MAPSRFKSKAGIYLFGKIRRTDWLPVRESKQAMDQDQVHRSEESDSDYDSEDEDARARPRDYGGDVSGTDYGSDYDYLWDDDAYVAGRQTAYLSHKAYWDEIRARTLEPGYQVTGTPIRND